LTSIWRGHDSSHVDNLISFVGIKLDLEVFTSVESKRTLSSEGGQLELSTIVFNLSVVSKVQLVVEIDSLMGVTFTSANVHLEDPGVLVVDDLILIGSRYWYSVITTTDCS
jgi:hypothetical protein